MSIRNLSTLHETNELFAVNKWNDAEGPSDRISVPELREVMGRGLVSFLEAFFTEEGGALTYTAAFNLPAGAVIHDIIVNGIALWDNSGAVTLKIGDTDDDGFYIGVNLKATDLLAGESLSFAQSGGKAGAYNAGTNTHWTNRYSATARTINAIITAASTGGSTGRTQVIIAYSVPHTQTRITPTTA